MARKSSVASFSIWSAPIVSKVCHIIMCTYVISSYVRMSHHHVYICHIIMCICHIIMCNVISSYVCMSHHHVYICQIKHVSHHHTNVSHHHTNVSHHHTNVSHHRLLVVLLSQDHSLQTVMLRQENMMM